jgi:hypothetical protein
MARKEIDITITSDSPDSRDAGKVFHITEMGAIPGEKWAYRAILAIIGSGKIAMPKSAASSSMATLAEIGIGMLSGADWNLIEPLLDEMMKCVQIKEPLITRSLNESDIEDIETLLTLRKEVLKLHLGFSLAERIRTWASQARPNTGSSTT